MFQMYSPISFLLSSSSCTLVTAQRLQPRAEVKQRSRSQNFSVKLSEDIKRVGGSVNNDARDTSSVSRVCRVQHTHTHTLLSVSLLHDVYCDGDIYRWNGKLRVQKVKPQIKLSQSQNNLVIARPSTLPINPSASCWEQARGLVKPGAGSFTHYLIGCWESGTLQ